MRCGRLHRVHFGVYAVGHRALTLEGQWAAAVLACGPGALLSHRDAAALWGILERIARPIDVLVASRRARRPGLVPHHAGRLHPDDHATRRGIPLTSVPRTLLDLCDVAPRRRVKAAFDEADRLDLLDAAALDATLARSPGRRGLGFLRRLLDDYRGPSPDLRSKLEMRFFELWRHTGLPEPETNVWIEGHDVDVVWREARLCVELDSWGYHRSRASFEKDRRRDGILLDAGWQPRRVTYQALKADAEAEVAAIARLYARRCGGGAEASAPPARRRASG